MGDQEAGGTLVLCGGKSRPVQRATARKNGFGTAKRAVFIEVLAATCNVALATEASGVTVRTVYRARRIDPAFAAQWDAALASGYDRLEAEALRYALERLPVTVDPHATGEGEAARTAIAGSAASALTDRRASDADLRFVLAILNRHTRAAKGVRTMRLRAPSEAETNARLATLLDTLARQMAQ